MPELIMTISYCNLLVIKDFYPLVFIPTFCFQEYLMLLSNLTYPVILLRRIIPFLFLGLLALGVYSGIGSTNPYFNGKRFSQLHVDSHPLAVTSNFAHFPVQACTDFSFLFIFDSDTFDEDEKLDLRLTYLNDADKNLAKLSTAFFVTLYPLSFKDLTLILVSTVVLLH